MKPLDQNVPPSSSPALHPGTKPNDSGATSLGDHAVGGLAAGAQSPADHWGEPVEPRQSYASSGVASVPAEDVTFPQDESTTTHWISAAGPIGLGLVGAVAFYGVVYAVNWGPLNRYFLGHPVAIAAAVLFSVACAILVVRALQVVRDRQQLDLLRDEDLLLQTATLPGQSPAQQWLQQNDAGAIARNWMQSLRGLPVATRNSLLVRRLTDVLSRQAHRSGTGELPQDLRELSDRDADAAHDSYGLIRIIVWAIPMLGFLGTVIGITQTLGGLDFSDGTAAVDRLKSGLYVAFDTTALGLVLSVLAIFLQFPVERAQQGLLVKVDQRVRDLVSGNLPSEDAADNQTALVTQLCDGIRVAVQESLVTQAKLWRETIEEAQSAWRDQHDQGAEQFRSLMQASLQPALTSHADRIEATVSRLDAIGGGLGQTLKDQTKAWNDAMQATSVEVQTHRRTLLTHTEAMTSLAEQQSMAAPTTAAATLDPVMEEAMRALARAVDTLSKRLPANASGQNADRSDSKRRAA
ncbi:MotA/TolQ/ExbB proton channel family protein [Rhodopirellula halodulae]|uniref:MotA/TolQ/ExbB proton channel family protein n=1 Tax=Rhodopirellula halodulae TaxID=2894198 RepID=UPI001E560FB1|nr:MotA/TolQ/ExbB proton channel family protein [Rhodopirellula sp. JC737]MCC9655372.1 MotA/TolQ/ExbB proton channel family protein [Rhodopirellula sp. JC737]